MATVLFLILISVYLYRIHLNHRLDRSKLSHSSYYDVAFGGERKCQEEAAAILNRIGGYSRLVLNWHYLSENGPAVADVLLIHETGIYLVETRDYQGLILGEPQDEYWTQTLASGSYSSYQNYFYNPVQAMEQCRQALSRQFPHMYWLPFFSMAVFSDRCELGNAGLSDQRVKIIRLSQLSYTIYGMIRCAHKFLAPQVIDEIYEGLAGSPEERGAAACSMSLLK